MTGETDSGITFGASIRADNAEGGEGGTDGQTEGEVFVSGSCGTLTYGDTNAADEQWVGDVPGDFSLTGLGELDETRFVSNGGGFGNDDGDRASPTTPFARPTVRYDFDFAGFGISLSSNRDLTDVGVGAGYAGGLRRRHPGASASATTSSTASPRRRRRGRDRHASTTPAPAAGDDRRAGRDRPTSSRRRAVVGRPEGRLRRLRASARPTCKIDLDDRDDIGARATARQPAARRASAGFDALSVGAVYGTVLNADGALEDFDGDDSLRRSRASTTSAAARRVNGGIANLRPASAADGRRRHRGWIGDFGIAMNF